MSNTPTIYEYKTTSACGKFQTTTQLINHKIDDLVFNIYYIEDSVSVDNSITMLIDSMAIMHIEITVLTRIDNSTDNFYRMRYYYTYNDKKEIDIIKNAILRNKVIVKNISDNDASILHDNIIIDMKTFNTLNVYSIYYECRPTYYYHVYHRCIRSLQSVLHSSDNKYNRFTKYITEFDNLIYNSEPSTIKSNEKDSEPSTVKSNEKDSEPSTIKSNEKDSEPSTVKSNEKDNEPSTFTSNEKDSEPSTFTSNEKDLLLKEISSIKTQILVLKYKLKKFMGEVEVVDTDQNSSNELISTLD